MWQFLLTSQNRVACSSQSIHFISFHFICEPFKYAPGLYLTDAIFPGVSSAKEYGANIQVDSFSSPEAP